MKSEEYYTAYMKKLCVLVSLCSMIMLTACKDTENLQGGDISYQPSDIIHVGGVTADGLTARGAVTRAPGDPAPADETTVKRTDAENIEWLRDPLFSGLDITYGLRADQSTSRVAQLKLLDDPVDSKNIKYSVDGSEKYAEYSFLFRDNSTGEVTANPAIWHGNGAHFFQGIYLPTEIKYTGDDAAAVYGTEGTAPNLTTNQVSDATTTGALGNYTLLSRYLAMPSNYTLNATVARVKLPFRHRLARVIAYILIDPSLGNSKLEGYKKDVNGNAVDTEDPSTTEIKFCNVDVLAGVKETSNGIHQVYTPQWTTARKAVPHFVGERGSYNDSINSVVGNETEHFIAYYNEESGTYVYPTDRLWTTLHGLTYDANDEAAHGGVTYTKTVYGKVPVYDLIVRPTYSSLNNVMYDEKGVDNSSEKTKLFVATNQIDFELELDNGLKYNKKFVFDLDANYQTVVYLHITREAVDYTSSGSELWQETIGYDDYYGVNNQNGNNLSMAGSSWQRAYTNKNKNYPVTDGHQYQQDVEDQYAQYVDDATWIEMLREAKEGGKHHGDYFILDHDIEIPAAAFGTDFVFTGHLDGQDYSIKLTNGSYTAPYDSYETYNNAAYVKYKKTGDDTYSEFVPATGVTYYQKGEGDTYTEITNMVSYAGAKVYTWEEHESDNYSKIALDAIKSARPSDGNVYCKKEGENYVVIDISGYITGLLATIYTKENEENYTKVNDLADLDAKTDYYKKDGENSYSKIDDLSTYFGIYIKTTVTTYTYTAIDLFMKVHHKGVSGAGTQATGAYMFAGLNGKYSTPQETNMDVEWQANVHKETNGSSYWVPYKTTVDGWRAEVINLNINGGTLFKSGTTYSNDTNTGNEAVTGYVHNCWEGATYNRTTHKWSGGSHVKENKPAIPAY